MSQSSLGNARNGYPDQHKNSAFSSEGIEVLSALQHLSQKLSASEEMAAAVQPELSQLQAWHQQFDWLISFGQQSHLLMAVIDLESFQIQSMNPYFRQLVLPLIHDGHHSTSGWNLFEILSEPEQQAMRQLYRRHVLYAALLQQCQIESPEFQRLLNQPILISLPQAGNQIQIELRMRSDRVQVQFSDSLQAQFNQLGLTADCDPQALLEQLLEPNQVQALVDRLDLGQYHIKGWLLLEGIEVTEQQTIQALIQQLIDRDSVLQPQKMQRVNQLMQKLFRADNSLILSAENDQARLILGLENLDQDVETYPMRVLQESLFFQAAEANRVMNVPNLQKSCPTACEQMILAKGVRSLLIIPLVVQSALQSSSIRSKLVGLVGLTSSTPYHFDSVDCRNAEQLIPALTAALRHAIQRRFTKYHPAVEWRFIQEAERRSWGLPPETIVFSNVYPLYGISDIRGSSHERNRAIQADLLHQFQLGVDVVAAVCDATVSSLCRQLRLDLEEQMDQLQQGVNVESEVTLTRYLEENLECHFNFFAQSSPRARAAVAAYQQACDPEHGGVYQARATYDQTIQQINSLLRDTWMRWQAKMQQVVKHYCDVESTDGIDHMIYVGSSIDDHFCPFHLKSLRYDQLRAVCDCARTAFGFKEQIQTDLEITHLVLVQFSTVDIVHDEATERLFDVRGSRDTRYEIVKKRIDKAMDSETRTRITQPGMLTVVYSTTEEWSEYRQYFRYLQRDGWIGDTIEYGSVEPLQGVTGLKFARAAVLPAGDG
jgi:hypothetical protein